MDTDLSLSTKTSSITCDSEIKDDKSKNSDDYKCILCQVDFEKKLSNPLDLQSANDPINKYESPEMESRLYTISENIFGLFCPSSKSDHQTQKEITFRAIMKIKECFQNSKIKLYCLTDVCPDTLKLCDTSVTFIINLMKPPKLKSILIFCESLFDWLAKSDDNRVLLYCQGSASLIILMVYSYSCYYDALLRRDMRLSVAMKSFVTTNIKDLEKVPISYRRYGGYMSLYSCMTQLQSLKSSVYLHCIILYNFPCMESDIEKSSQLFFKIYTNDPCTCCHTTKLYCLPSTVNRLVILFDKFPISLQNDSMVVCYHRSLSNTKRIKLFRINFHTCQAVSDILTFYCHDFEDVYQGCSLKMKLDFYFRHTAVYSQGENDYVIETSHSNLSAIERADSYSVLETEENSCKNSSSIVIFNNVQNSFQKSIDYTDVSDLKETSHRDSTSITVFKASVEDHRDKSKSLERSISSDDSIINQNGRISGPIDSHHSTKLDTVRTSSTILNGKGPGSCYDYKTTSPTYGTNSMQNKVYCTNTDREKCSQQLDTLMKDLNLENANSSNSSRIHSTDYFHHNDGYHKTTHTTQSNSQSSNNQREIQLMTELLEAQKEISNLRRSMNHLDITDQPASTLSNHHTTSNSFSSPRSRGITKGSISCSTPDTHNFSTSRIHNWSRNGNDSIPRVITSTKSPSLKSANAGSYNVETSTVSEFHDGYQTSGGYSAHRENMERDRMMKEKYMTTDKNVHENEKKTTDVFEEIETINLQPIGKGIQDLAKGNYQTKMPPGTSRVGSTSHLFSDHIGSLSPLSARQNMYFNRADSTSTSRLNNDISNSMLNNATPAFHGNQHNVTLQMVEDKIQYWYQPQITRDETIAVLRNCAPGSFLVRDSNTYYGAYGLAIKVASIPQNITVKSDDLEAEKVRHYLIELIGSQGVCFKGFPEEPIFPSLSHLVLYYTHTLSVLPCLLVLPDKSPNQYEIPRSASASNTNQSIVLTSPKFSMNRKNDLSSYSVYYLGCYDVEYITGPSVINRAVERLLEYIDARRFTECELRINSGEGIVLTDLERKLFFRRNHPFSSIIFCATDPRDRKVELDLCKSKGIKKTKVFGIIVKAYIAGENKCFLFGELNQTHKASFIVKLINEQMQKCAEKLC